MEQQENTKTEEQRDESLLPKEDEGRIEILRSVPVGTAIWRLSLPMIMGMLIQTVYNMTDMFYIGQLNNASMVAAIAVSMPIVYFLLSFADIFSIGGASLISRLLGEGYRDKASNATAISFWTALVLLSIMTVFGYLLMEPVLILGGASETTLPYCISYYSIILIATPFMGMQFTIGGLLRAEGATKEAMTGMVIGSILNIILDPIFIFLMDMGINGAAIATTIGNIAAVGYYISFYVRKKGLVSIAPKFFTFKGSYFAAIFKIGVPASLGMVLMSVGFILANVYAATFGDVIVAANGIAYRATDLVFMMTYGLAQGCQPLLGFNYGAMNFSRMFEAIKKAATYTLIISISLSILYYFFAEEILRFFIKDAGVVLNGAKIIRPMCFSIPFMAIQLLLVVVFQSLGKSVPTLIISIGRQGIFFIPPLIIFSMLWGFEGFVWALPFSDIFTTLLAFVLYLFMQKGLNKKLNDGTLHVESLK